MLANYVPAGGGGGGVWGFTLTGALCRHDHTITLNQEYTNRILD